MRHHLQPVMTSISPYILEQLRARDAIPKATPAYLATAGSPLKVDTRAYTDIQVAPRVLLADFTLPIRSGRAWEAPAGSIIKISTPEGPQVGMCSPALPNGSSGPKLSPSRPGDLNIWNRHNPRERFWASRTRQLYASHVSTHDRLWSCLPYLRPMATILHDSLAWYGIDRHGGRVHDLLGTRCDPYVNTVLAGEQYDFHCHSNLTRAVAPFGLAESDVHDVINIFQVTGLDEQGRYFMNPCPAQPSDCIEFLAEQDLLMALSEFPRLHLWLSSSLSLSLSLSFIHSLNYSSSLSPTHSFTHLITRALSHPLTHSFMRIHTHLVTESLRLCYCTHECLDMKRYLSRR